MEELIKIIVLLLVVLMVIGFTYAKEKEEEQLQRYCDGHLGMSEKEMLDIMGDGYSRSLLKNIGI